MERDYAIDLLEKRVKPIDVDGLKDPTEQEQLISALSFLAELYAESAQFDKSLELRRLVVERAPGCQAAARAPIGTCINWSFFTCRDR